MDSVRLQQHQERKDSVARHRQWDQDSGEKWSESPKKNINQAEKRPFRRLRSPSRSYASGSFKPVGRVFRPCFQRDDHFFRKPGFGSGLQRFHYHFSPRPHFRYRAPWLVPRLQDNKLRETKARDVDRGKGRARSEELRGSANRSPSATRKERDPSTPRSMSHSSRESVKNCPLLLSFTVPQEGTKAQSWQREPEDAELPSRVSCAAARNRAIQQKRTEIEEVYKQDCDTLGLVVRMLISKEPSLELPIQSALKENLREVGLRCVEAMQKFIDEYDARNPSL